jgi:hypothetical protein
MAKKVTDKQVAGIKAHADQKNKETIEKVNKAIDKLKRSKTASINFETVAKEAEVSRATLYNNPILKERILSLRTLKKDLLNETEAAVKKDKMQLQTEKIHTMRQMIKQLEEDKKKLIFQLVQIEELKEENERLNKQLAINMNRESKHEI